MTVLSSNGKNELDKFIKATTEGHKNPAIVFGVTNVDGEIYFQGGGTQTFKDDTSPKVDPDSVFWLCSQTKLITAIAVLKLLDQGKLKLDTPISDYFPQFRNPIILDDIKSEKPTFHPAKTVITLKHLLNFTSGLFYPEGSGDNSLNEAYHSKAMHAAEDPVSEIFRIIIGDLPGLPLKFEPGTDFVYGWSSDILGFLVEKVSGQTLEQFCKDNIFAPLGMKTSYYLTPDLRQKLVGLNFRDAQGKYNVWQDQLEIIEQDPSKVRIHLGGVGLYSSMRDYLKLLRHILQIDAGRAENPILKAKTVRSTFEPALTEAGSESLSAAFMRPGTQWGTAQAISTQDSPTGRKKGSAWWGGWAGTRHFIDPTSGIAVVFGVQVAPPPDLPSIQLYMQAEGLVYAGLVPNKATS